MIPDQNKTSDGSSSVNPNSPSPCEAASLTPLDVLCNIAILLDAIYCGALLIDRTGRLMHVNRRLCDMMQRSPSELIGRTLLDLYPEGP
ncbi:MAG TPA: PAS domain-containing protein, partial [Phycisphaerales bacterium]|nr:PAS domain-containing protein [Phycisphaerales bacterium]